MSNKISGAEKLTMTIIDMYNDGLKLPSNTSESIARFNEQVKYEESYKENNRVCHTDGHGSILGISVSDLSGIHKNIIIDGLKRKFYDYNFINEIRCMMNLIIDMEDGDGESERSRIHRFIADPKRFGAPSAYNYAMKSDFVSEEDYGKENKKHDIFKGEMVVVKCPREPSSAKELIHELCVGLRLFELRKYGCCNFSMVYDAWYCGAPVVNDTTNEVNNWCMTSDNPVSYVAYEMIHDAKPFNDIAKDKSTDINVKMAKYLMQMCLSEYLAERFAGFQHYDAHGGNVILRPFPTVTKDNNGNIIKSEVLPFYMYYPFEGKECFVPTPGEVVTFIDYGMSRIIMEDGVSVGKLDASGRFKNSHIANPDDGNVLGDVYKLICAILSSSMYYSNNPLTIFLAEILNGFFFRDNKFDWNVISETLNYQSELVFLLPPPLIRERGLNIIDFINYLHDYALNYLNVELLYATPSPNEKIFGYAEHFESEDKVRHEIGLEISEVPTLYDLSIAISSQSNSVNQLLTNVNKNIDVIIHNETIAISSIINTNSARAFIVLESTRKEIEEEKEIASRNIEIVAKVVNNCYELIEKLKVYNICKSTINNKLLDDLILRCQKNLNRDIKYIENIKSHLFLNANKITKAMKEPSTEKDDPLFNLNDKYEKTISALKKISITL